MTETQHKSEMEAAMDSVEMLLEAVSVAKSKVREQRNRRVQGANRREATSRQGEQQGSEDPSQTEPEAPATEGVPPEEAPVEESEVAREGVEPDPAPGLEAPPLPLRAGGADARFETELRLPIIEEAIQEARMADREQSREVVEAAVEQLGARVEGDDIVIPLEGTGNDVDARMESSVSAWRTVNAGDLALATFSHEGERAPTNMTYLGGGAGSPAPGVVEILGGQGQIRLNEEGLLEVTATIHRGEVSDQEWEQLAEQFGQPDQGSTAVRVPVSADPHGNPMERVIAARRDLPGSLQDGRMAHARELAEARRGLAAGAAAGAAATAAQTGDLDLLEKVRPDGSLQGQVWVDGNNQPTGHPEGVPSVWYDEQGKVESFGSYEDGNPVGTWHWTDSESHSFAASRAEMGEDGPVAGTLQTRDSADDEWSSDREPLSSPSTDASEPNAGPTASDPSPGPAPGRPSATPPMPDPSSPSTGPRLR